MASEPVTRPRQPAALYFLCASEVGDRAAFYGLLSVFVLYLSDVHGSDQADALLIFGVFMSLSSLTILGGGLAADRYFGFGRSIITGSILLIAGYMLLALAGHSMLFAALALLAVGNGLTKPNIPALLGQFYTDDGEHRTTAFTHLYTAVNAGAFFGILAMGSAVIGFGYGIAFAMAGGTKLLGLIAYLAGRRWLSKHDSAPQAAPAGARQHGLAVVLLLLAVALTAVLLAHPGDTGWVLILVAGVALGACLVAMLRGDSDFNRRLLVLIVLVVAAIVFWAIFRQFVGSVLLFTQADVDRSVFGWQVPASDLAALNPAFILIVGPLAAWLWPWLAKRGKAVDDYWKFALGLVFAGLAFLVLSLGALLLPPSAKLMLAWVVLFQLILALGEICLSPVGLALTAKLAPRSLAGSAMGIWYLSTAFAFYLAGVIAQPLAAPEGEALAASVYGIGFAAYGAAGVGVGIIFALFVPWLRRLTPP